MLYESISSSLNDIVNKILLEKKQEISPEDERDNEVLRNVIKKIRRDDLKSITKAEKEVLKRNGFSTDDFYDGIAPAYGYVDYESVWNPYHDENDSASVLVDKRVKNKKTGNVNIADLGRKRQQRKENHDENDSHKIYRYSKKNRGEPGWDGSHDFYNIDNYQDLERRIQNKKLSNNYALMRDAVYDRKQSSKEINYYLKQIDYDRNSILDEIERLKNKLRNIDSKYDDEIEYHTSGAEDATNRIQKILNDKKQEIANKKNKKTESLNRNKRYKHI